MTQLTSTPLWLELKTQYIDDNFDALLQYLKKNGNSNDIFLKTTIELLARRANDVVTEIAQRPVYKDEEPLVDQRKQHVRLLAAHLLASPDAKNRCTSYVAMLSELKAIVGKFEDSLTRKITESIRYQYIYQIGISWDDIIDFHPQVFATKVIDYSKFGSLLTDQHVYSGYGTIVLNGNGLSIINETREKSRTLLKSGAESLQTGLGISMRTSSDSKLKQSLSNDIDAMNSFVLDFIAKQKTVSTTPSKKILHNYSDGDSAVVQITDISHDGVISVQTVDTKYNNIKGVIKYKRESLMYYYTDTLYKEFRKGDYLTTTITSAAKGHFSIDDELVRFMVEDCRETNGTFEDVLCKLIDVKPHMLGWITDLGTGIYTKNDGKFSNKEENVFAYLRMTNYGAGKMYGKIDAEIIEYTDHSFEEQEARHGCITAFAERTKAPVTTVQTATSKPIDVNLLNILVRTLFASQKKLLRPVERFCYLGNIWSLAVALGDEITESYLNFTATYLRQLVLFVKESKIDSAKLVPDDLYAGEPSVKLRLAVITLLGEYGKTEYSSILNDYIEEYHDSFPTISTLARLVQTTNNLIGTLSEAGINIIKREIIRTLSLETENDADLESENKVFIGVESGTMEFKGSFVYPAGNNMQPEPHTQMRNVFKGLCAFLNSSTGGTLYLGVRDNGYVCGLENDFQYLRITSIDSYMRYVQDNAKTALGLDSMAYIRMEPLHDNNVVAIHVEPHPYRVVELEGKSFIRVNAESREMPENMRLELIDRKMLRDKDKAAAISKLQHAAEKKKVVILHGYSSSNSLSVSDRKVEAYEVKPNDGLVFCLDYKDYKCKVFNISRIGYVEITDEQWIHTAKHEKILVDAFHMSGKTPISVSLKLDIMAKNLLIEEFPTTKKFIEVDKKDGNIWYLTIDVYSIYGIGRFYVGLANHIEILNCPELKAFAEDYKQYL